MKQIKLKIGRLFFALTSVVSLSVEAEVIISEYVEGTGNNKAIEISNMGDANVNLDGYQLIKFSNGSSNQTVYNYRGNLEAGASLVLYNSQSIQPFKVARHAISEIYIVKHNGNDQFTLNKNGIVVDSIGQYLNLGYFLKDVTLRRNTNITIGDTNFTDEWTSAEWTSVGKDIANGLGCPGINRCAVQGLESEALVSSSDAAVKTFKYSSLSN